MLTNLELAVMREVWAAAPEPLTVRGVADRLNRGRRRPLAYNTVQTMLAILREKGVVESRAGSGRAHCFRSRVTRQEVTTSMVGDLIDRLFDGKVEPLLLQLVGGESLGRADLERLRSLIESQLCDEEAL
ncbi:MAG: BlaI/MecI/CopY family transcriptional regulator [Planctomycetes bacterium]|nr:BlaI/MecI/CopY family transcriptional regulator [Planctomycetota bacterium]